MDKIVNSTKYIRHRLGMFTGTRRIIAFELSIRGWKAMFYDVLHAFSIMKSDDGVIRVAIKDNEFCFTANRQIFLNDSIAIVQALSDTFSVIQTRRKTEVRFKLCKDLRPEYGYDEEIIEDIIKDYAYLHSNQTIVWKEQKINYPEGIKDMLKYEFGISNVDIWVIGRDIEIVVAKNIGSQTVIDYVNTKRTYGGEHATTLQTAIEKYFPDIAKEGYIALIDLKATDDDLIFESVNSGKVSYLSDHLKNRIFDILAIETNT